MLRRVRGGLRCTMSGNARHRRWFVLAVTVMANASFSAAFQGLPTTAVMMRRTYGFTDHQLGLLFGIFGLGIAVSEIPWGIATDRWGDRTVLLIGLCGTATVELLLAVFGTPGASTVSLFWPLVLGLLLVGTLGGSINGSSGRALMLWFAPKERGVAMSVRQTAIPLGGAVGAALLPLIASKIGFSGVYAVLALGSVVSGGLVARWLVSPETRDISDRGNGRVSPPSDATSSPVTIWKIWRTALAIGVLCIPQFAVLTFGFVFLHDYVGLGMNETVLCFVLFQFLAIVLRVWSGWWTDRRGNRRGYLRACTVACASAFVVLAAATSAVHGNDPDSINRFGLASLLMACGVIASVWHGVAYTELATIAGAQHTGTALGMANAIAFVALFITPVSVSFLVSESSWSVVWVAASICAVLACIAFP